MKLTLKDISEGISNTIFPVTCPVCSDVVTPKGRRICGECKQRLVYLTCGCLKCGSAVRSGDEEYCDECRRRTRTFDRNVSVFEYDALMQRMIGDFKFRGRRDFKFFFADELEMAFKERLSGYGVKALVPVPVHPSRERFRGYNQSKLLCEELSKRLDIPVYECLHRKKKTAPQKELDPAERRKNLFEAMEYMEPEEFGQARYLPETVLVVDDIFTTGATAEACARVLKANGIDKVYVLCIATGNNNR